MCNSFCCQLKVLFGGTGTEEVSTFLTANFKICIICSKYFSVDHSKPALFTDRLFHTRATLCSINERHLKGLLIGQFQDQASPLLPKLHKIVFQVFKSMDKSEFLNMLSGDKKSSTVQRAKKSEVPKIEQKIKEEDSGTW